MTDQGLRSTVLLLLAVAVWAVGVVGGGADPADLLGAMVGTAAPLVPLALGLGLVLAIGDLDLSVAGSFSLFGMLLLTLASAGWSPGLTYSCVLVLSVLLGLFQGMLVARVRVSALVLTLAMSMILGGIAILLDSNLSVAAAASPDRCVALPCPGDGPVRRTLPEDFRIPLFGSPLLWATVLVGGSEWWRRKSLWALQHLAIGYDRRAATLAGLSVVRLRVSGFVASSVGSFLSSALLISAQRGGWTPSMGVGIELKGIAIAVIGGTSISGGRFEPRNIALAAAVWMALDPLQALVEWVHPQTQQIFVGTVLAIVAVLQTRRGIGLNEP